MAILGNREMTHGTAESDIIARRLALCKIFEEVKCSHNLKPLILIINFSHHLYDWEVFRQQAMVERLSHIDVDILLLAPGQSSLEEELNQAPTVKLAVIQWCRQLRRTILTLKGAVKPRQGMFLSNLPSIIVVLPNKSK